MSDLLEKIQWHPAFYAAAGLELMEDIERLEIRPEYNLSKEPIRIDLLIIKNDELVGTLAINVSTSSQAEVILHLPFPVISIFLPSILFFSISKTLLPRFAAVAAAIIPAGPPPITIIFLFSVEISSDFNLYNLNSR